jgi:hypothetical protein
MATRRFYRAIIEGMEFSGIMSVEGPYVATQPPGGGVALEECLVLQAEDAGHL